MKHFIHEIDSMKQYLYAITKEDKICNDTRKKLILLIGNEINREKLLVLLEMRTIKKNSDFK